jgi:hypothetical protein
VARSTPGSDCPRTAQTASEGVSEDAKGLRVTSSFAILAGSIRIALAAMAIVGAGIGTARAACDYYAAPGGNGNGTSAASPFKVSNFWSVASAGRTLCLLDGTYAGGSDMILPPQGLSGVSGAPITVRALNDGKAFFTGSGTQVPLQLYYNSWFVIEGINACCSSGTVVMLANSNHNIIRRVAAWDAADSNSEIFGIHAASFNLLEDVAAWGTARKTFQMSQGGDYTTIRRAWGRWERSTVVGPKMTYTLAYNNYHTICENCIGTWSGQSMPQSYVLRDYYGNPWTGPGAGTYNNYDVDQPMGIFAVDGETVDMNADIRLLGSLAYVLGSDRYKASQAVLVTRLDSVEVRNTVVHVAPGASMSPAPLALYNMAGATNLRAFDLTAFGGSSSTIDTLWSRGNVLPGTSPSAVYAGGENVFNATRGANLCYAYQDGGLTTQPLWPWPMNERIKSALALSGRAQVDVTALVQSLFGAIPGACMGTGDINPAPTPTPPPVTPAPTTPPPTTPPPTTPTPVAPPYTGTPIPTATPIPTTPTPLFTPVVTRTSPTATPTPAPNLGPPTPAAPIRPVGGRTKPIIKLFPRR